MSVCSATPNITTDQELQQAFPNSVLPASGASRDNTGRLLPSSLQTIYNTLVSGGRLVSNDQYIASLRLVQSGTRDVTTTTLEQLHATENATMQSMKEEFCFNYVRYKFALDQLFQLLTSTAAAGTLTQAQKSELEAKLNVALQFNEKLNDLIQITNFLAQQRATEMRTQNAEVNAMNTSIQNSFSTLKEHNRILKQKDALANIRKRMVEFTQEKNLSASNLLSLYGFLNLVALGLLFYIYRT